MNYYLYCGAYSSQGWVSFIDQDVNVRERLEASLSGSGGRAIACFLNVEKHQAMGFVEFLNERHADAWAMKLRTSPQIVSVAMTKVITAEELIAAIAIVKS